MHIHSQSNLSRWGELIEQKGGDDEIDAVVVVDDDDEIEIGGK